MFCIVSMQQNLKASENNLLQRTVVFRILNSYRGCVNTTGLNFTDAGTQHATLKLCHMLEFTLRCSLHCFKMSSFGHMPSGSHLSFLPLEMLVIAYYKFDNSLKCLLRLFSILLAFINFINYGFCYGISYVYIILIDCLLSTITMPYSFKVPFSLQALRLSSNCCLLFLLNKNNK